jgi:hypothetical protein
MLGLLLVGRVEGGRFLGVGGRDKLRFLLAGRAEGGRYVGIGIRDEFGGLLGACNLYATWLRVNGELMDWTELV